MPVKWDFSKFKSTRYLHRNYARFDAQERFESGLHELTTEGIRQHFYLDTRASQKEGKTSLVIVFHGAASGPNGDDKELLLPYFNGLRMSRMINSDTLLVSDATLSMVPEPVRLAWFTGTTAFDYPSFVLKILRKIITANGYDELYFCGGSGGGFAAMRAALEFPGSLSIVCNPQTCIGRYHAEMVQDYAQQGFGVAEYDQIPKDLRRRRKMNLVSEFRSGHELRILYMQNRADDFHIRNHVAPLLRKIGVPPVETVGMNQITPEILFLLGNWGKGHAAPPEGCIGNVINLALAHKGDFAPLAKEIPTAVPLLFTF